MTIATKEREELWPDTHKLHPLVGGWNTELSGQVGAWHIDNREHLSWCRVFVSQSAQIVASSLLASDGKNISCGLSGNGWVNTLARHLDLDPDRPSDQGDVMPQGQCSILRPVEWLNSRLYCRHHRPIASWTIDVNPRFCLSPSKIQNFHSITSDLSIKRRPVDGLREITHILTYPRIQCLNVLLNDWKWDNAEQATRSWKAGLRRKTIKY